MPEPKLYAFSTHIGSACNKQSRAFADLAEELKMDVVDLKSKTGKNPERTLPRPARHVPQPH
jgi:hypothetical protein